VNAVSVTAESGIHGSQAPRIPVRLSLFIFDNKNLQHVEVQRVGGFVFSGMSVRGKGLKQANATQYGGWKSLAHTRKSERLMFDSLAEFRPQQRGLLPAP
jgi:hypothetical protein